MQLVKAVKSRGREADFWQFYYLRHGFCPFVLFSRYFLIFLILSESTKSSISLAWLELSSQILKVAPPFLPNNLPVFRNVMLMRAFIWILRFSSRFRSWITPRTNLSKFRPYRGTIVA